MKFFAKCVMFAGLLGSVGCTGVDKAPERTQAKRIKSPKPQVQEENIPAAVSKLLPPEQVDARNARAQARVFEEQLSREKSQLERTETAQRD